ncbi:succinate-semialdehyde dehydrogenase, partial [Gordonia effusa NBRC 100432]
MSTYAVTDPATGEIVATYPTATDTEIADAITAASDAASWVRSTSVADRAELIRKVGALHHERREQLADIIVREMGKPRDEALGEVDFCTAIYDFY